MTTETLTFTEFLTARLDEDERAWQGSLVLRYAFGPRGQSLRLRLAAEVAAKRRIVELHGQTDFINVPGLHLCQDTMIGPEECETLRALASVYADHEAFREEWT